MSQRERIEALLAERVTEGLSPELEAELGRLLGESVDSVDESVDSSPEAARWDAAAAAVAVAFTPREPMPPGLAQKLLSDAELFVAGARREARKRAPAMTTGAASAAELGDDKGARPVVAEPKGLRGRWGWLAAAAAFALFAGQTWRLESAGRAAAAPTSSTLHATCTAEGKADGPVVELLWNAPERQGVLVFDRSAAAAPSGSGHAVYRCVPAAP
ncbi:MAG TPA: hypothetical protein VFS00_25045 [Polyangiaceae bacterium]|nr:hypothetical protein [Polyangiaceae bacterium]